MGAIYKRKRNGAWDGNWRITWYDANGQRRREFVGPSHALAKEVLAKREHEAAEGHAFPERHANAQLFRDFAEKFFTLHGQRLRSPWWARRMPDGTLGGMVGLWLREFGAKRLSEIRTADVQAAYNRVASANKGATANRYYTLLRLMFNCAQKWGDYYGVNPCRGVRREAESVARTRYLSRDEIAAFLPHCHPRLVPVVMCALLTGLRKGEIFALEWRDVDFVAGILSIPRGKGKPRIIPLPGRLRDVLLSLGPRHDGKVFELPRVMFYRYFDKARKDSGLEAFRFHDLRHTFASHHMMRNRDLATLQRILGHATPTMTMRYAHLDREHVAATMAAVETVIPLAPAVPMIPAPSPALDAHSLPRQ